jgi:AraC family transcriptional regulator
MELQPRFVHREKILLIGICEYGAFFESGGIPRIWDRFIEVIDEVPNRVNAHQSFGLEFYPAEFFSQQQKQWNYMAAVEVSSLDDIPVTMVGKTLPAHHYALFTHRGAATDLARTFQTIFDEWFPRSDYAPANSFDFELYDARYNPHDESLSEVDIYIPVRTK